MLQLKVTSGECWDHCVNMWEWMVSYLRVSRHIRDMMKHFWHNLFFPCTCGTLSRLEGQSENAGNVQLEPSCRICSDVIAQPLSLHLSPHNQTSAAAVGFQTSHSTGDHLHSNMWYRIYWFCSPEDKQMSIGTNGQIKEKAPSWKHVWSILTS